MEEKRHVNYIEFQKALEDEFGLQSEFSDTVEPLKTANDIPFKNPFRCSMCGKAFTKAGNLKRHERIHTGNKPFSCSQCDYKCKTSGDLKRHKRIHTGEKPFSCSQCDFKCSRSGHLKRHERTHTVLVINH